MGKIWFSSADVQAACGSDIDERSELHVRRLYADAIWQVGLKTDCQVEQSVAQKAVIFVPEQGGDSLGVCRNGKERGKWIF